jgi:alpha-D-ribose 1-methylphosphonate 5-triphosphate synthase subunit PhnG
MITLMITLAQSVGYAGWKHRSNSTGNSSTRETQQQHVKHSEVCAPVCVLVSFSLSVGATGQSNTIGELTLSQAATNLTITLTQHRCWLDGEWISHICLNNAVELLWIIEEVSRIQQQQS